MGEGDYNELYKSVYITLDASNHNIGLERARRAVQANQDSFDFSLPDEVPFLSVLGGSISHDISIVDTKKKSTKDVKKSVKDVPKKKVDPNLQPKIDFLKLLNFKDPSSGCSGLNVSMVNDMMDEIPSLAKEKYLFAAFPEPVSALHMLCAIDAPIKCIKRCFHYNVDAVMDASSTIGSPIHYACWFRASVKTVRYIASHVEDPVAALSTLNRTKRTPLHIACQTKDSLEMVQLLTSACPHAAGMADKDGLTPLHVALSMKYPQLLVIEDLTEVCPKAVGMTSKKNGSTPLHMAIEHENVEYDIIKDLVVTYPRACKVVNVDGNTPLHSAVMAGRDWAVIKLILKKEPDVVNIPNNNGDTPYMVAKSLRTVSKDIMKLIKPISSRNLGAQMKIRTTDV